MQSKWNKRAALCQANCISYSVTAVLSSTWPSIKQPLSCPGGNDWCNWGGKREDDHGECCAGVQARAAAGLGRVGQERLPALGLLPASTLRPWPRTQGSARRRLPPGGAERGGAARARLGGPAGGRQGGAEGERRRQEQELAGCGGALRCGGAGNRRPRGRGEPRRRRSGLLPPTYLGQPTSCAYRTAAARPWRKAAWRPGTAASPISPASWSPRRERRGQRHRGTPAPRTRAARGTRRYRGGC